MSSKSEEEERLVTPEQLQASPFRVKQMSHQSHQAMRKRRDLPPLTIEDSIFEGI